MITKTVATILASSLICLAPSRIGGTPPGARKAAIGMAVIPTTTEVTTLELAASASYGRVALAIEPLALGPTDGKGLLVTDATGKEVQFTIGDDQPVQIWSEGSVRDSTLETIEVGDCLLYTSPSPRDDL